MKLRFVTKEPMYFDRIILRHVYLGDLVLLYGSTSHKAKKWVSTTLCQLPTGYFVESLVLTT